VPCHDAGGFGCGSGDHADPLGAGGGGGRWQATSSPPPGHVLHVEARYDDTEATIVPDGEFDMAGVARFWGYFTAMLTPHPLSIAVDVRGVIFIDSSGLTVLERARDTATEAGVAFRIRQPSPALRRIAEMCGLEDLVEVEDRPPDE
jgi:anti-anti-sigma factor